MLDRFNQRERIMLLFLILLVIIALYYFFIYQPMEAKIITITAQIEQYNNDYQSAQNTVKKLPAIRKKYGALKEIEGIVIERHNITVSNVLNQVDQLSSENNINIITFFPREEGDKTTLNFVFSGNYMDYCRFLEDLKVLKNKVQFNTLKLETNEVDLRMNITLTYENTANSGAG